MESTFDRFDRLASGEAYKPQSRALDPREIVITPGWNVRDVDSEDAKNHIAAIKASIIQRVNEDPPLPGLIKPIEVTYDRKTGTTTLVDGQCRLIACRELWDEGQQIYVPCKIIDGTKEQLFAESLTSNGGKPLTQWEIGAGCRKLNTGYGWSVERIAAHICKPKRYVTEAIALSSASAEAKTLLSSGTVTPGAVLHAVKESHGDQEAAAETLKKQIQNKSKDKPLARPKAKSTREDKTEKSLELADKLVDLILDDGIDLDEVTATAKEYREFRK